MGITLNRITVLARFVLLPALLIGDCAAAWSPLAASLPLFSHFGLGYATLVTMLLAFRRRSAGGLAVATAILLVIAWAVGAAGDGLPRMLAGLAGVFCGMLPAGVREWQRLARDDLHMHLGELRLLWRRRKRSSPPVRSTGPRQGHVYLAPAPPAGRRDDRVRDPGEAGDTGRAAPDTVWQS